jgi:hypothetical protein
VKNALVTRGIALKPTVQVVGRGGAERIWSSTEVGEQLHAFTTPTGRDPHLAACSAARFAVPEQAHGLRVVAALTVAGFGIHRVLWMGAH